MRLFGRSILLHKQQSIMRFYEEFKRFHHGKWKENDAHKSMFNIIHVFKYLENYN